MYQNLAKNQSFPIAEGLASQGSNLLSSITLSKQDVEYVYGQLIQVLTSTSKVRPYVKKIVDMIQNHPTLVELPQPPNGKTGWPWTSGSPPLPH